MSLHNRIGANVRNVKRNRRQAGRYRPRLEALEVRETPAVTVFQHGVAGYAGTQDVMVSANDADTAGDFTAVQVAGPGNTFIGQTQGLIRFDDLFGSGANQIPIGARINAAALTVEVGGDFLSGAGILATANVQLHRMLVNWTQATATWNFFSGTNNPAGVQTNGVEAAATPESTLGPAVGVGPRSFNVTDSLQAWSYTTQPNTANRGWFLAIPTGTALWQFASAESPILGGRPPILAVDWTAPTPGTFDFSAPTYSVTEGTANATITVNRTNGGVGAVAVNYAVTNGTATGGQDFTAATGTLNFAANEFSKTFTVAITNDTAVEPDETIHLTLSSPTNGSALGTATTAVLSLVDNDGPGILQFSAANYTVNENVGNATITVNRVRASDATVTVAYTANRGTATPGVDFTATTGTLSFGPGQTSRTFTIPIINDILLERQERIIVTLSSPTGGATLGAPTTATVTINDNEPPFTFQQGVAGYNGTQDTAIVQGEPNTPHGNETSISVDQADAGGVTRGLLRFDNIFGNGPNQIPLGSTIVQGTFTFFTTSTTNGQISIYRMLVPWDESVTWNSSAFGGNGIATPPATVPDGVEAQSTPDGIATDLTVNNTAVSINVVNALQAWSNGAPNHGWVFINSSTDGWDFASSENATVANRPRLTVLAVPPNSGQLNFSAANYTVDEAGTTATVTVARTLGAAGAVSVTYTASSGTATAGDDFSTVTGTLSWAAGETTAKTFTIPISNDSLEEADETITVVLSNPTNGAVLGEFPDATVTIVDNDSPGTLQFSAPTFTVHENGGTAVLTVSRARASEFQGTVTVDYAVSSGTAVLGQDFTSATGTLTFAPGETSKTFTVSIVDDSLDELDETLTATLSNATSGALLGGRASAVLSIVDNERSLVIQEGLNGYASTQDTTLRAATPGTTQGNTTTIITDLDDGGLQVQGLLRFDNLFGTGRNQIPPNAVIHSATLTVQVTNASNGAIALHRMLVTWNENSTWNSLTTTGPGVQVVTEAALVPDNQPIALAGATGPRSFDVTNSLQAWLGGASNFGWVILNTTTDGWDIVSSEGANGLQRPRLEVVYSAPAATTPLRVGSFTGNANGFTLGFNQPFDHNALNVFGGADDPLGLPDVTLVGPNGPVAGSLIVNPTNAGVSAPFNGVLSFIPTGGPLAPGTYTVTLRSGADGFKNLYGALLLDGNGDNTAGDNYTNTFTVAAPAATARVVGLPDFVRGPNQAVNLPTGIPLRLSDGQGVTAVSLQIRYDPALLTISGVTTLVTGATVTVNTNTPGLAQVTFTRANALGAGAVELARLTATVPASALYSAKHVLDLVNVTITTGATTVPAVEDDGLHIVSYLGDLNGSGAYESADAVLVERYLTGLDAGFPAYQMADPTLVADITQNGQVTSDDVTAAAQLAAGTAVSNVPARPATPASPIPGGPDPRLYIPSDLAGAIGATVTVPVLLEITDPAGASITGVDVALRYDASRFTVSNAQLGDLLAGFGLSVNAETPGELRLVAFTGRGPGLAFGASGAVFLVDFTVLPGAATGASVLNLVAGLGGTTTALYGNDLRPLTLIPAPTDGADDPVDGFFTITVAETALVSQVEPVLGSDPVRAVSSAHRQDGVENHAAAVALLLGATDEGTGQGPAGNLGGATAGEARDAFFGSYGREGEGVVDLVDSSQALRRVLVEERTGENALEDPEGGDGADWFDVDAFFGSLADRG